VLLEAICYDLRILCSAASPTDSSRTWPL